MTVNAEELKAWKGRSHVLRDVVTPGAAACLHQAFGVCGSPSATGAQLWIRDHEGHTAMKATMESEA